jgi:hypothetical protein
VEYVLFALDSWKDAADMLCRSIPGRSDCENGKDRIGFWSGIRTCTGCSGCNERETTRLCRFHIERRQAESRSHANGDHLRMHVHQVIHFNL